ncbi:SDR family oxidoreductase [Marinihelvus fidelis]|uniref:SDR family oxidoreductase n=1 Tax=Marinihelvus fidelis TaxID=2613842 RepID=A0A5N0TGX5_9GAMM|nr:SDR family oxidoreductase [Marinihelvus fidelis]KAA9132529.1 SDR family oxidoreductase [Marinihelvus fidelis]
MNTLENRVAIVTGASSGIGRATALAFAREGAAVVVSARRQPELDQLAEEIKHSGGRAVAVAGDICEDSTARALVETAESRFGGLDIAFNNAGTMGEMGPTTDISLAGWQRTLDINLTSAFLCARYQLPALLRRGTGSLIFTSTFVGHTVGFPGVAAYAASKAGLTGLVKALAAEFGPQGIRVNALLPGGTDTPMAAEMNDTPEALAQVANLHALKRIARPEELAEAALFLASPAASFMTGSAMLVDGGVSINRT